MQLRVLNLVEFVYDECYKYSFHISKPLTCRYKDHDIVQQTL
jgi:hypothetical protein